MNVVNIILSLLLLIYMSIYFFTASAMATPAILITCYYTYYINMLVTVSNHAIRISR